MLVLEARLSLASERGKSRGSWTTPQLSCENRRADLFFEVSTLRGFVVASMGPSWQS